MLWVLDRTSITLCFPLPVNEKPEAIVPEVNEAQEDALTGTELEEGSRPSTLSTVFKFIMKQSYVCALIAMMVSPASGATWRHIHSGDEFLSAITSSHLYHVLAVASTPQHISLLHRNYILYLKKGALNLPWLLHGDFIVSIPINNIQVILQIKMAVWSSIVAELECPTVLDWRWRSLCLLHVSLLFPGLEHHLRQLADLRLPHLVLHTLDGPQQTQVRHAHIAVHGCLRKPAADSAVHLEF